ncbi:MAG: hypothetical protein ACREMB_04895 [Candidatus Rokuibacteriota bacterium]
MVSPIDRPCANPACSCQTTDFTCSLWCGALDRPAGVRCVCRHDGCARPLARASGWTARSTVDPLATGQHGRLPGIKTG